MNIWVSLQPHRIKPKIELIARDWFLLPHYQYMSNNNPRSQECRCVYCGLESANVKFCKCSYCEATECTFWLRISEQINGVQMASTTTDLLGLKTFSCTISTVFIVGSTLPNVLRL